MHAPGQGAGTAGRAALRRKLFRMNHHTGRPRASASAGHGAARATVYDGRMQMWRHGGAMTGGHSSPVRRAAAMLATVALLMQMAFAFPLAVRMALAADPLAGDVPICSAFSDGGTAHQQLPADADHGHERCLLCHAHGLPLAPVIAFFALLLVRAFLVRPGQPAIGPPVRLRRFEPYTSRAPPLMA